MITISFKNKRGLLLQASLWQAPSDAIVIMAHGSAGNRNANGLFPLIANELVKQGYNALAFDFSGHGASQDDILTLAHAADDVRAAIDYCTAHQYKKIVLLGHSLGAYACLAGVTDTVSSMILVGALTGPVEWFCENRLTQEQAESLKKYGYISVMINDGLRAELNVDGKLLDDIRAIDQQRLLSSVSCPVLIVHGDADQDEHDLYEISAQGIKWLPKGSRIEVINGATHNFLSVSDQLIALIRSWLAAH